jgi:hypothetical protein
MVRGICGFFEAGQATKAKSRVGKATRLLSRCTSMHAVTYKQVCSIVADSLCIEGVMIHAEIRLASIIEPRGRACVSNIGRDE